MEALLLAAGAALLLVLNQRSKAPAAPPAATPAAAPPAAAPSQPGSTRDPVTGVSAAAPWPVWQGTASLRASLTPALQTAYDAQVRYLAQYAPSAWRLGQQASVDADFAARLAGAASPPAPTAYHSTYPFQARTRAGRSGDSYDSAWGSVPVLRQPGAEGNALGVQGNVLMRVAWWSQLWLIGPSGSGPAVAGVPYSDTYFPVQGGGYVRMSDLSLVPS